MLKRKGPPNIALARIWYWLAMAGYVGLLALILIWNIWIIPANEVGISLVLIIMAAPLLFPLKGMLKASRYTFAWGSFLAMAYFAYGVMEAWASQTHQLYGLLMVLFSLMWFGFALAYVRMSPRADELALDASTSDGLS